MARSSEQGEFYRMTGEVIRGWAKLEQLLSQWLIDLLGVDELRSRLIWDSYGDLRAKLNLLKALVRNFTDEGAWGRASAIFAFVETIAENRYILPHAFGEIDESRGAFSFYSERPDNDFVVDFGRRREIDTRTLVEWLQDIADSQGRIAAFRSELPALVHRDSLAHRRAAGGGIA